MVMSNNGHTNPTLCEHMCVCVGLNPSPKSTLVPLGSISESIERNGGILETTCCKELAPCVAGNQVKRGILECHIDAGLQSEFRGQLETRRQKWIEQ